MPFAGIREILEPFFRGATRRPKEAPFQKGSRIFNMVTSYEVISLDHLAEHMIHLSTASSFWFSLNSSYDNEFHLSNDWVPLAQLVVALPLSVLSLCHPLVLRR